MSTLAPASNSQACRTWLTIRRRRYAVSAGWWPMSSPISAPNNEPVPQPLAETRYSGKFMTRIPPELHRQLAIEAAQEQISLNRLVSMRLTRPKFVDIWLKPPPLKGTAWPCSKAEIPAEAHAKVGMRSKAAASKSSRSRRGNAAKA